MHFSHTFPLPQQQPFPAVPTLLRLQPQPPHNLFYLPLNHLTPPNAQRPSPSSPPLPSPTPPLTNARVNHGVQYFQVHPYLPVKSPASLFGWIRVIRVTFSLVSRQLIVLYEHTLEVIDTVGVSLGHKHSGMTGVR
jgi:hypothetical protein